MRFSEMSSYFLLFLRLLRFLSLGGCLFKSFTKMRLKRRIFALCKYLAIKFLIRILRSYPKISIFQNKKKERFRAAPLDVPMVFLSPIFN